MDELQVGESKIELVQGDITRESTAAIVNAANTGLRGGGGVDGAIHRAGGPVIMEECRRIGHCDTGDAVATTAGRLQADKVIHTAGPVWHGGDRGEAQKLACCYRRSLELTAQEGLRTVAFPSISTGVYGYPVDEAAQVAVRTVRDWLAANRGVELVRFVLFDERTYRAYAQALAGLGAD